MIPGLLDEFMSSMKVFKNSSTRAGYDTSTILFAVVGWLVGFYGISTFVGYLTPNPSFCKCSILFQTIQFTISTQFNLKNISISSDSIYSNSSNSANSVYYKY